MIAQIQMRRGTTAEWAAASPVVLAAGEQGYDTTLKRLKMGDGATAFSALEWNTLLPYPIGAIYMSVDSTSPATLFGGTWAALGGRMLIGVDGTYTAGSTGGAATHTLTTDEMPSHKHQQTRQSSSLAANGAVEGALGGIAGEIAVAQHTLNTGGGGAHNNLPPYLAVYMWKRTA